MVSEGSISTYTIAREGHPAPASRLSLRAECSTSKTRKRPLSHDFPLKSQKQERYPARFTSRDNEGLGQSSVICYHNANVLADVQAPGLLTDISCSVRSAGNAFAEKSTTCV